MPINNVPSTPEEEVLLLIGDEDEELITSAVITYILSQNDDDVNRSAIAAIKYIIASLTKKIDEEVGDVKVKFSQLLDNYKSLLADFLSDPAFALGIGLHKFGGVSKVQSTTVRRNSDSRGAPLREGFFTEDCDTCSFDQNDIYALDCD